MHIISSFFCFLLIFLSFNSNSSCGYKEEMEKIPYKPSPLRKVLSHVDLSIEGPLREQLAEVSLNDSRKRKAEALQSMPKRHSPE